MKESEKVVSIPGQDMAWNSTTSPYDIAGELQAQTVEDLADIPEMTHHAVSDR